MRSSLAAVFAVHLAARTLTSALFVAALLALPAVGQTITVSPDRASATYELGEAVQWTVTVTDSANLRNPTYTVKSGGFTTIASGSLALVNGQATISSQLGEPGWLYLEIAGTNAANATIKAYGGALIAPESIKPAATRPDDFDSFWDGKLAALAAIPINPVVTPGVSDRAGVDYATVTLDGIGGTRVQGQLARPTAGTKFPALLVLQWAGVYGLDKGWATWRAAEGWLVLNTQAHDIAPIESPAYYSALSNGALNNYPHIGNEDRETSYFLRMYLACHRAAEYLTTRSDWDGRTLVVTGASQGGLQSLVAAGLHPKITAVVADVPAGSDQWALDAGRLPGWPVWMWQTWDRDPARVKQAALYYDVTHFIDRITCPVLLGVGLLDSTVPPPSVFASYNRLKGARQIVVMPLADHVNNHAPWDPIQQAWMTDARTARAPTIRQSPQPVTVATGGAAAFAVTAENGQVFGYQWLKNGAPIAGARSATLCLADVRAEDAGEYAVEVSAPGGTVTSTSATLTVVPAKPVEPAHHLANLSARCFIGAGDSIGIAGFVLARPASVLIRGIGPSLDGLGVADTLDRPVLRVFDANGGLVAANQGWKHGPVSVSELMDIMQRLRAFAPTSEDDSILYLSLPAGLYTAQLNGADGATGNGLIEVYSDRLVNGADQDVFVNLSARCLVGTDASIAIAGLVLDRESTVLVRAVGPSLAAHGVSRLLRKPELTLHDSAGAIIAGNSGWGNHTPATHAALATTFAGTGAFAFTTGDDSALLMTLSPGLYTAQARGMNRTTGNGLVEIYLVP